MSVCEEEQGVAETFHLCMNPNHSAGGAKGGGGRGTGGGEESMRESEGRDWIGE